MLFIHRRRGMPEESNNPETQILQWPASLEIARLSGIELLLFTKEIVVPEGDRLILKR